jgi:hypothetical protein
MSSCPQAAFGAIAGFLGLRVTPDRIARAIDHSSFAVLEDQERRKGFRERSKKSNRFFDSGRVGRGKEILPPALVEELAITHREQMERFGYGPGD